MPGKSDELLTEQQVADMLKVSRSTVRSWRSAATGPPVVYAGRFPRYWRSAVERWLTERKGERR
jgi:predicted DNA-binding transcriptional regulator AlpA